MPVKSSKTVCGNILKIDGCQDIQILVLLQFQKLFFTIRLLIKHQQKKINSAKCFGDNYLTSLSIKVLNHRIKPSRVGALRVSTGYHFFKKEKSLVRVITYFNLLHDSC